MSRHGAYANRNRAHRDYQARVLELARAQGSWEELRVTFDAFRAAVKLLRKRRPPRGTPPGVHETQAETLTRQAISYLAELARRIDAGDFDARKAT
jgi:hypothetical protein